jgi:hypothetical protein
MTAAGRVFLFKQTQHEYCRQRQVFEREQAYSILDNRLLAGSITTIKSRIDLPSIIISWLIRCKTAQHDAGLF